MSLYNHTGFFFHLSTKKTVETQFLSRLLVFIYLLYIISKSTTIMAEKMFSPHKEW